MMNRFQGSGLDSDRIIRSDPILYQLNPFRYYEDFSNLVLGATEAAVELPVARAKMNVYRFDYFVAHKVHAFEVMCFL